MQGFKEIADTQPLLCLGCLTGPSGCKTVNSTRMYPNNTDNTMIVNFV